MARTAETSASVNMLVVNSGFTEEASWREGQEDIPSPTSHELKWSGTKCVRTSMPIIWDGCFAVHLLRLDVIAGQDSRHWYIGHSDYIAETVGACV